jgi:phosphonoacetaldehyde hydrolase
MTEASAIRLVVLDGPGTLFDFGGVQSRHALLAVLAQHQLTPTVESIAECLGLAGRDAIPQLLVGLNEPLERAAKMIADLDIAQQRVLEDLAEPVPHAVQAVELLRQNGTAVIVSTCLSDAESDELLDSLGDAGIDPTDVVTAEDVPCGAPAPWIVYRAMEKANVYPASLVMLIADTPEQVLAAVNAGVWAVGITSCSAALGLDRDEFATLSEDEREASLDPVRNLFLEVGVHAVIDSMDEVPQLLEEINKLVASGDRP